MSTSVCLSVCFLSVCEDISETARAIFAKCFVHVAYGRGSVLLRRGDEIPREWRGGGFFPNDIPLYSIAFGTHTKRLNRSRCRLG